MLEKCINTDCRYQHAFKGNDSPMLIIDFNTGNIKDANKAALDYYKYNKQKILEMNISDINMLSKEEIANEIEVANLEIRGFHRLKHRASDGEVKDVNVYSDPMKIKDEDLIFMLIIDATKDIVFEKEAIIDKARFENLFNNSGEAIAIIDTNFNVININNRFKEVFQYEIYEVEGKKLLEVLVDEAGHDSSYKFFNDVISGNFIKEEVRRRRKDGSYVEVLLMGFPLLLEGEIIGAYFIYTDISESKENKEKIQLLTNRDTLTGLYNRDHFLEILNFEISRYNIERNEEDKFVLASLSVNEYYEIKEALGHQAADQVLQEFSFRLNACKQPQDIIARYSEGLFLILMPKASDTNNIVEVIIKTMKGLNTHFYVDDHEINVTTNMGIAIYPDDGDDSVTLLRNADIALIKSQKIGSDSAFIFENSLDIEIQEYFWMKNDLFRAIELNEFFINYQPIYNSNTNKLVGTEALIRWNHRFKGIIPPLKFIPISEKTGMIYDIGVWVMQKACEQNKKWQDLGYDPIYMSVNVSVLQLEQNDFCNKVKEVLERTGLDPKYLQLEITETYFKENYKLISNNMKKLNALGIKFAIDDFGTGYSSLGQLSELNINTLKIDRMFIDRVDSNINNSKIVKAVISLAKSLNIGLTAEGVERFEELSFLKENKCDIVQGYLFSRPVEASQIQKYLTK